MLALKRLGAVTFDYGNNLRTQAKQRRRGRRLRHPRLRARIHPPAVLRRPRPLPLGRALRRSRGHLPHRPSSRSSSSPTTKRLARWIDLARERIHFQGLPARICWLGYGERAEFGLAINELVP